jgi:hypothetical protein
MKIAISAMVIAAGAFLSNPAFASDTYKIQVTRKGQDLYKIEGRTDSTYVKTAYCYEYATWEEAILILESQPFSGSIAIGKIIFTSSDTTCQVDTVLQ